MATRIAGGGTTKALSVDQFFEYLQGLSDEPDIEAVYQTVAWCYRCVNLRANALGAIPYTILRGENETEWPIPLHDLWWVTESALCLFGAAYWLKRANRMRLVELQWLNPLTMRVKKDARKGIVGFEQDISGSTIEYKPEQIVYYRLWHPADDLGPGISPMRVALEAAGLAKSANRWASRFFEHGAIPAVILHSEAELPDAEIERVSNAWRRLTEGVEKAWRTLVLRRGLKPEVIGMPVRDLAMPELMDSVRSQVAVAFGVPETMIADAANYATAKEHRLSFYQETVIPEGRQMETTINEQLFTRLGLEFKFQYDQIEALQKDEAEKAFHIVQLLNAGIVTVNEAREQMGLEPFEKEQEPTPPAMQVETPAAQVPELAKAAILADLRRWRTKAKNRGADVAFESEHIPASWMEAIKVALAAYGDAAFEFLKQADVAAAEAAMAEAIVPFLEKWERQATAAILADRPVDWDEFANEFRAILSPKIGRIATEQALRLAVDIGVEFDIAVVNELAADWARTYTFELVRGLTETTRKVVQNAITQYVETPGMARAAVEELLAPAFGQPRASMIAVTEVTRAYSRATTNYQQLIRQEAGLEMERVWRTNRDDIVCPICAPLDGQPESKWASDYPDGPPAHVNCRCSTTLRFAGAD